MERGATIFVAGSGTFVGAALERRLRTLGRGDLVGGAEEPDLTDPAAVDAFFARTAPGVVFLVAGRSAGISANQRQPADLMLDNLLVQTIVMRAAHRFGVRKLLYLSSACTYPRECPQPMRPEQLGTGPVEPTSEAYATAKLAGMQLCQAYARQHGARFVTVIPANAFGPGDDTRPEDAHVVGALMRRMHEAKQRGDEEVVVWGSGLARRDLIFVDDLADACVFVVERYQGVDPINVSGGLDVSVGEIAERIKKAVGFEGRLRYDSTRPDGAPAKLLDGSVLGELGWRPRTNLDDALAATYRWFRAHEAEVRPGA